MVERADQNSSTSASAAAPAAMVTSSARALTTFAGETCAGEAGLEETGDFPCSRRMRASLALEPQTRATLLLCYTRLLQRPKLFILSGHS